MDLNDFFASLVAVALGEGLSYWFGRNLEVAVVRRLQENSRIQPKDVDSQFPIWLRDRSAASISSVTGIPTLYLTLLALESVPALAPLVNSFVGFAVAVAGTILMLAYGWVQFGRDSTPIIVSRISAPGLALLMLNFVGLIALLFS